MWRNCLLVFVVACLANVACDRWEEAKPGQINSPAPREPSAAANKQNTSEYDLARLQSDYDAAKAKLESDPGAKSKFVEAAVRYADALNYGPGDPRHKYPAALAIYEEVLKVEPENEAAKSGRKIILDVYKSMGMEPRKIE